jgi:hypothetical protein
MVSALCAAEPRGRARFTQPWTAKNSRRISPAATGEFSSSHRDLVLVIVEVDIDRCPEGQ